jgi:hypothetical protein
VYLYFFLIPTGHGFLFLPSAMDAALLGRELCPAPASCASTARRRRRRRPRPSSLTCPARAPSPPHASSLARANSSAAHEIRRRGRTRDLSAADELWHWLRRPRVGSAGAGSAAARGRAPVAGSAGRGHARDPPTEGELRRVNNRRAFCFGDGERFLSLGDTSNIYSSTHGTRLFLATFTAAVTVFTAATW